GSSAYRMMTWSGQRSQGHPRVRWPGSCNSSFCHRASGLTSTDADCGELAHAALAGPHGRSRVPFQHLDVIEPLSDSVAEISARHIGAKTNKSTLARGQWRADAHELFAPHVTNNQNVLG